MAQRRMFSLQVVDTDRFLEMPPSTQLLYFQLGMHGDDDGFVDTPKKITRSTGCSEEDLQRLVEKGLIIPFESGVMAITDWLLNNTLKNDRYRSTIYSKEKNRLFQDQDGKYRMRTASDPQPSPLDPESGNPGSNLDPGYVNPGSNLDPQRNLTEPNSTELYPTKDNLTECNRTQIFPAPAEAVLKSYGKYGWVKLTDGEYAALTKELGETEVVRCIHYLDECAQSTGNKNRWQDWSLVIRRCHRGNWGLGYVQQTPESAADRPNMPGLCLGKEL